MFSSNKCRGLIYQAHKKGDRLLFPGECAFFRGLIHQAHHFVCLAWRTYRYSGRDTGSKTPAVPGRKGTPTRQGHRQRWRVWRKYEVEPGYVMNSEPATWRLRRRSSRRERARPDIPANRTDVKPDGIWGGSASYSREALLLWGRKLPQVLENRPDGENPKREGTEGGRFT